MNGAGRGTLPSDHRCAVAAARGFALGQADFVLVLGAPLDFRLGYGRPPTFAENVKVAMIDADPSELGRNRALALGAVGDIDVVLRQLLDALPKGIAERLRSWREAVGTREAEGRRELAGLAAADDVPISHSRLAAEIARGVTPEPRAVATSLPTARYDLMVEALGGRGALVTKPADLGPALERALASDDVWCINVVLDPAAYRRTGQVSMAI